MVIQHTHRQLYAQQHQHFYESIVLLSFNPTQANTTVTNKYSQ